MKPKNKLLVTARAIGVWWGIYLILGCCALFAIKMIQDIFLEDKPFRIILFVPFMIGGSLVLAAVTYVISSVLKRMPAKRLRRRLVKIVRDEGFSRKYTDMLFDNARDDMKNPMLIEAAAVYCLRGETKEAGITLDRVDLMSILDVAQSTGNFITAAYYYCVKMAMCIIAKNGTRAAEAYDEGNYYIEAFPKSDIVALVLALYQTEAGFAQSAVETLERLKWRGFPKPVKKYGKAFANIIKAKNFISVSRYEEAIEAAKAALYGNACTEYMTSEAKELLAAAESKRNAMREAAAKTAAGPSANPDNNFN